jgi:hypothetical protein
VNRAAPLGVLVLVAGAFLTACGGGTPHTTADSPQGSSPCDTRAASEYPACRERREEREGQEAVDEETTGSAPSETPGQLGGPVSFVGTITGSDGKGTTLVDRYSLGPLIYGSEGAPPEVVLNTCRINEPSAIASSVFARGHVTTIYQEGSLPLAIPLNSWEELAQGGDYFLIAAFRLDGEWRCNSETELGAFMELEPGDSLSVPIWVVGVRVLTNAQPELPASVTNAWYFKFTASVNGYSRLSITGPGAAQCEEELGEEQRLMLWNRSGSC